jgi:hypothetical protein
MEHVSLVQSQTLLHKTNTIRNGTCIIVIITTLHDLFGRDINQISYNLHISLTTIELINDKCDD